MFFEKIYTLNDIRDNKHVIEHIMWDIKPRDLMESRFHAKEEGFKEREPIRGYIFYIETSGKKPTLFLMMHTSGGYAETVAQIDEISPELLLEAIEDGKDDACFGMYPINKKIEDWLKKELGVL